MLFMTVTYAHSFPHKVFIELIQTVTKSVEFSFNNIMYRQIDGVAMDFSLGPALANNFFTYCEFLLFERVKKPLMYCYLDNTLLSLIAQNDCNDFHHQLNFLHPSLQFSFKKVNSFIPKIKLFLNTLVIQAE